MIRFVRSLAVLGVLGCAAEVLAAQQVQGPVVDSIVVEGAFRVPEAVVIEQAQLRTGFPISFPDLQRAITALFSTGNYDDVQLEQREVDGRRFLVIRLAERPLLVRWTVEGANRISQGDVRRRVQLIEGRPLNPAALRASEAAIDSMYRAEGYYRSSVATRVTPRGDSSRVAVVFSIEEGERAPIAQVVIEGNEQIPDHEVAGALRTSAEGFWWFRSGEFDEAVLEEDLQVNLPSFYAGRGFIDFQVLRDTVIIDEAREKATLIIEVREGERYRVGSFEIVGNRRYSGEELRFYYPFGSEAESGPPPVFDQASWEAATTEVEGLYRGDGFICIDVRADGRRRLQRDVDGNAVVDLTWTVLEGEQATINRVDVVGNTVTHERVIRDAILILPGAVYNEDLLLRSYQNILNLGFFDETMPPPDIQPVGEGCGLIDITFQVAERSTGNVNFGASLGQGVGVGGFLGLEQPNLFGRGKRGTIRWQFGRNINDLDLSYTDPAIRGSLFSGSVRLHNTRLRYTVADLGRVTTRGVSLRFGFPFFNRFNRAFISYDIEQQDLSGTSSSTDFNEAFRCDNCVRSTVGFSFLRDTRIGLPFPADGAMQSVNFSLNGGVLGGTGSFQRLEWEGQWFTPLGFLGGDERSSGMAVVLGFQARSGFVFGDAGPFFRQLFAVGGTQFGIPLRGYDEFAITPLGIDPLADDSRASVDAFGKSYFRMSGEIGLRVSQTIYLNTFFDAGNSFAEPEQFNPTRLFRGAGVGINLVSPLGPIGLDYAYGFDRVDAFGRPDPAWKLHFKIGQLF